MGTCGSYTVYKNGNSHTAAGWSGSILVGTNSNNTLNGSNGPDLILGLGETPEEVREAAGVTRTDED